MSRDPLAFSKRILLTGASGLMGSEFVRLGKLGEARIFPYSHAQLDISNSAQLSAIFADLDPHLVINCAGYTHVDGAETQQEEAWKANVEGPRLLSRHCRAQGATLVHFSSDAVFNGAKDLPYVESDLPEPISYYGKTKLEGERAIQSEMDANSFLILRILWPYGENGRNFINDTLRNLKELSISKAEITAVADQKGTPNPARLLAEKTLNLVKKEARGLLHLSCMGACSKFEFLSLAMEYSGHKFTIRPSKMGDFPSAAKRPINAVLGSEREELREFLGMPTWQEALKAYLEGGLCF